MWPTPALTLPFVSIVLLQAATFAARPIRVGSRAATGSTDHHRDSDRQIDTEKETVRERERLPSRLTEDELHPARTVSSARNSSSCAPPRPGAVCGVVYLARWLDLSALLFTIKSNLHFSTLVSFSLYRTASELPAGCSTGLVSFDQVFLSLPANSVPALSWLILELPTSVSFFGYFCELR